jgi:hypothetical protein
MPWWKTYSLIGLGGNITGVVLLFFYVLPRRTRTEGKAVTWISSTVNESLVKLERRWDVLSMIGLWSVIVGTLLQAIGTWIAP